MARPTPASLAAFHSRGRRGAASISPWYSLSLRCYVTALPHCPDDSINVRQGYTGEHAVHHLHRPSRDTLNGSSRNSVKLKLAHQARPLSRNDDGENFNTVRIFLISSLLVARSDSIGISKVMLPVFIPSSSTVCLFLFYSTAPSLDFSYLMVKNDILAKRERSLD